MVEVTLLDALAPIINIMGGLAGLTILFFIFTLWQNKRKLSTLKRIERELERIKQRGARLAAEQRRMNQLLERRGKR
jgi:hypothetical protein